MKLFGKHTEDKEKKIKLKKILIAAGIAVIGIAMVCCLLYQHYYDLLGKNVGKGTGTAEEEMDSQVTESPEEMKQRLEEELQLNLEQMKDQTTLDDHIINVLLIGVDSRDDDLEGRSDAMIVFTINKDTKKMVMTSLMRDCYVSIPGYGNNRLNAAYSYGGAELLYQTIQANIGIPVDKCVVVNFQFVAEMVDALHGVDLSLSQDEVKVMNDYVRSMNTSIFHEDADADILPIPETETVNLHLNGKQALGYCRNRYTGTDYNRTERQRKVVTECLRKIKALNILELHELAEELLPEIGTDLSSGDVAELLLIMADLGNYELEQFTIPEPGTAYDLTVNGMMVLGVDYTSNLQKWNQYISEGIK